MVALIHRIGGDHKFAARCRDDCGVVTGTDDAWTAGVSRIAFLKQCQDAGFAQLTDGGLWV